MRSPLIAMLLLVAATPAFAQKPPVPKWDAPWILLASAAEKDGSVTVSVFKPTHDSNQSPRFGGATEVSATNHRFREAETFTLGKQVRAIRADGKPVAVPELVKLLAMPRFVTYFATPDKVTGDPEAFYLNALREDSIVLIGPKHEEANLPKAAKTSAVTIPTPIWGAPSVLLATAVDKDGKVFVGLQCTVTEIKGVFDKATGKMVTKESESRTFSKPHQLVLGDNVRALETDGKPISPQDLAKRLAQPTPVAVFSIPYVAEPSSEPEAVLLNTLRKGTVVLITHPDDVLNSPFKTTGPKPKKK